MSKRWNSDLIPLSPKVPAFPWQPTVAWIHLGKVYNLKGAGDTEALLDPDTSNLPRREVLLVGSGDPECGRDSPHPYHSGVCSQQAPCCWADTLLVGRRYLMTLVWHLSPDWQVFCYKWIPWYSPRHIILDIFCHHECVIKNLNVT